MSDHYSDVVMPALRELVLAEKEGLDPKRLLIVGQAPGRPTRGTTHYPMFPNPRHSAGGRLWHFSGWPMSWWLIRTERVNTLPYFPGSSGGGHQFPISEAKKHAAERVKEYDMHSRDVLFVGKGNARVYDWKMPEDPMTWIRIKEGRWAWIPHTSGRVQFWNNEQNRYLALKFFEALQA